MGASAFLIIAVVFVLLGALGGGPVASVLGCLNGLVGGIWWEHYWTSRDDFKRWHRAREAERENSPGSDTD